MQYVAYLIEALPFILACALGVSWSHRDRSPRLAIATMFGGLLLLVVARVVVPSPIALALIGIHDVAVVVSFLLMAALFIVGANIRKGDRIDRETMSG